MNIYQTVSLCCHDNHTFLAVGLLCSLVPRLGMKLEPGNETGLFLFSSSTLVNPT